MIPAIIGTTLKARWFPYVAIATVVVITTVSGYSYMKGYQKAELKGKEKEIEALNAQREELERIHRQDLDVIARGYARRDSIEDEISELNPIGLDCKSDEWLHVYNEAIGIINSNTGATP